MQLASVFGGDLQPNQHVVCHGRRLQPPPSGFGRGWGVNSELDHYHGYVLEGRVLKYPKEFGTKTLVLKRPEVLVTKTGGKTGGCCCQGEWGGVGWMLGVEHPKRLSNLPIYPCHTLLECLLEVVSGTVREEHLKSYNHHVCCQS